MLAGVITERYDVVEFDVLEFIDMLGQVARDVHPRLGHDLYSVGIEAVDFNAG